MTLNSSDFSFVCQFNFKFDFDEMGLLLIRAIEKIFCTFKFPVKKICLNNNDGKIYRISQKQLNNIICDLNKEFRYINFRSDFRSSDFEPDTRFYAQIKNNKDLLKVSVVIKEQHLLNDIFDVYKTIVEELSTSNSYCFTGYSFYISNCYGPVSFSSGILRRLEMSKDMLNLAHWYTESDLIKSTIGYLNCFSYLSDSQNQFLIETFGRDNVSQVNNATIFKCDIAFLSDDDSYFTSTEYNKMCDRFEKELPFIRNQYYSFL